MPLMLCMDTLVMQGCIRTYTYVSIIDKSSHTKCMCVLKCKCMCTLCMYQWSKNLAIVFAIKTLTEVFISFAGQCLLKNSDCECLIFHHLKYASLTFSENIMTSTQLDRPGT